MALVEQELSEVRLALAKAELEMKSGGRIQAPKALQQWLQKTYQLESQNFQLQKNIAMSQMSDAKEAVSLNIKQRIVDLGVECIILAQLSHCEINTDVSHV